jgi:hypothetical protein
VLEVSGERAAAELRRRSCANPLDELLKEQLVVEQMPHELVGT